MGMSGRLHIGDAPELLLARSITESEVDNFRCRLHAGIARTSCQNAYYSSSTVCAGFLSLFITAPHTVPLGSA
jgi:hypothetical protein